MFAWKIIDLTADESGLITQARYHVTATDDGLTVESEGNWFFQEPKLSIPFDKVTEKDVIDWIKKESTQDDKNPVECRLTEQLEALASQRETVAPWLPQVFTPNL